MDKENRDFHLRQLSRLGEMMGDGMHHEPDGKWIPKEYKKIAKALDLWPKQKRDVSGVDERMAQRLTEIKCPDCGGELKQTRSGSMRAQCVDCAKKYKLLKRRR